MFALLLRSGAHSTTGLFAVNSFIKFINSLFLNEILTPKQGQLGLLGAASFDKGLDTWVILVNGYVVQQLGK
ncbi:hypothetical protein R50071_28590 [Halioxenophilus aromaticivorans]